jgi:hypothetical protein
MAQYEGMDRFQTGKALAHRKAEIQATTASIVRRFKAGEIVNEADLDYIIGQGEEIRKAVLFWNDERRRELRQPVKTP